MKCYLCKNEISIAHRHYMSAKDHREKAQFRDICEKCYPKQMNKEGYVLDNGIWQKR